MRSGGWSERQGEGRGGGAPALDGADVGLGRADGRRPRHRGPRRFHDLKETQTLSGACARTPTTWGEQGGRRGGGTGEVGFGGKERGAGAHRVGDAVRHAYEPLAPHRLPAKAAAIRPPSTAARGGASDGSGLVCGGGRPCRGGTRRRRGGACSRRARPAPARRGPPCPAPAGDRQPAPNATGRKGPRGRVERGRCAERLKA